MENSVRAKRVLQDLGVERAFAKGDRYLLLGPIYTLRRDADVRVRMVFLRDDRSKEILVGYATAGPDEPWTVTESEPYSMRSYGYYQRRLKRIGDWDSTPPAQAYLEL